MPSYWINLASSSGFKSSDTTVKLASRLVSSSMLVGHAVPYAEVFGAV